MERFMSTLRIYNPKTRFQKAQKASFCKFQKKNMVFITVQNGRKSRPELAKTTQGTESTPKLLGYANFMTIQALFVCHLLSLEIRIREPAT